MEIGRPVLFRWQNNMPSLHQSIWLESRLKQFIGDPIQFRATAEFLNKTERKQLEGMKKIKSVVRIGKWFLMFDDDENMIAINLTGRSTIAFSGDVFVDPKNRLLTAFTANIRLGWFKALITRKSQIVAAGKSGQTPIFSKIANTQDVMTCNLSDAASAITIKNPGSPICRTLVEGLAGMDTFLVADALWIFGIHPMTKTCKVIDRKIENMIGWMRSELLMPYDPVKIPATLRSHCLKCGGEMQHAMRRPHKIRFCPSCQT